MGRLREALHTDPAAAMLCLLAVCGMVGGIGGRLLFDDWAEIAVSGFLGICFALLLVSASIPVVFWWRATSRRRVLAIAALLACGIQLASIRTVPLLTSKTKIGILDDAIRGIGDAIGTVPRGQVTSLNVRASKQQQWAGWPLVFSRRGWSECIAWLDLSAVDSGDSSATGTRVEIPLHVAFDASPQLRRRYGDRPHPASQPRQWWPASLFADLAICIGATLLAGGLGHLLLVWWSGRHRHPEGHCTNCGYNLTGLTRPRCPECGTPFPTCASCD